MDKKFKLVRITSYNNIEIDSVIAENQGLTDVMLKMCNMLKENNLEITEYFYNFGGRELIYHTTDTDVIYCIVEVEND